MIDDLYLGAYWRPRKESTEKCAERLLVCLNELAKGSEVFASWYDKARSKRDGKTRELELSRPVHLWPQEKVVQLLEMGRNRRDLDKSVIEELGYHVSLWNWGEPNRAISPMRSAKLDVHCGVYAEGGNYVVVDFPEDPDDLIEKEWALQALVAVVRAWEPDWAGIVSRASRSTRPFTPGSPFVDWMIYLNRLDIAPSQLPSSASVVKVDGQGSIIITQDVPVDANDQSQVQNVRAVEAVIPV